MTPAGDVYGGGSPTGNVFYENGALGSPYEGMFLAADAGRNEIFSYQPVRAGAGFELPRKIFVTSNVKQEYAGSDFVMGVEALPPSARPSRRCSARPTSPSVPTARSTSATGSTSASAATRISTTRRRARSIASRRRASPRRCRRSIPKTVEGLITALRSPAVNVRAIGFEGLKARGATAVNAVAALLKDPSPYVRGRAIYLLYQMGPEGIKRAGTPESYSDPLMKITAYRAMRRAELDILPTAARLARDTDPGVRREVALSMRDVPAAASLDILVDVARGYDGKDRSYLEAFGTGATEEGSRRSTTGCAAISGSRMPLSWSPAFAQLAWRLHVPAAVPDVTARAQSAKLSAADRRLAMDTLAFTNDPTASKAMLTLAGPNSSMREGAIWWLLNRVSGEWAGADYNLRAELKTAGIYDPDTITLKEVVTPAPAADLPELSVEAIAKLTGNAARGKETSARCQMCHTIDGVGAELGPALEGWGRGKSAEVIATAIVNPNAEIAFGYEGTELKMKDGLTIQGVLIKQSDPLMMRSMGGVTQIIPNDRVATRQRMKQSLMMNAAQLGLTAQDVADLVAFLQPSK